MDTPVSTARDFPQHQTTQSCTRKRASANIFQGVDLLQLRRLFHSSGDTQAEERAQLVWECAGNRSIAQALQRLHRRQRKRRLQSHLKPSESGSGTGLLELQHFNRLRIEDCSVSCTDVDCGSSNGEKLGGSGQTSQYPAVHYRQKKRGLMAAGYLHQLHR